MSGFGERPKQPQAYVDVAASARPGPASKDPRFSNQPYARYTSPGSAPIAPVIAPTASLVKVYRSSANPDRFFPSPANGATGATEATSEPTAALSGGGGRRGSRVAPKPTVAGDGITSPLQTGDSSSSGGGNKAVSEALQLLAGCSLGALGAHGLAQLKQIVAELDAQQQQLDQGADTASYSSGSREGTPNSRSNGGSREGTPNGGGSSSSSSSRHRKQDSRDSVTTQLFDHPYERAVLSPNRSGSGAGRAGPNAKMFSGTAEATVVVDFYKPPSPKPPSPKLLSESSQPPLSAIKVPFSKSVPLMATGAVPPPDTSKSKNLEIAHHSSAFRSIKHSPNLLLGEPHLAMPL